MSIHQRNADLDYVNPEEELNAGIWTLYAGATAFLAARIWTKAFCRNGLWYDDYILLLCWVSHCSSCASILSSLTNSQLILTANDIIISVEYATGYVEPTWDDRMHILINITSSGTLLGQCLTKTAFAVTLLKLTRGFSHWKTCHCILWFCIVSMCSWNFAKVQSHQLGSLQHMPQADFSQIILEWAKLCDEKSYDVWYRLDFCLMKETRSKFKEGGNCELPWTSHALTFTH